MTYTRLSDYAFVRSLNLKRTRNLVLAIPKSRFRMLKNDVIRIQEDFAP